MSGDSIWVPVQSPPRTVRYSVHCSLVYVFVSACVLREIKVVGIIITINAHLSEIKTKDNKICTSFYKIPKIPQPSSNIYFDEPAQIREIEKAKNKSVTSV